ncbi:nucleotidyltransferase domain-containing protein [Actinoplanes sp. CA-142083]|uniref:nucleotidyltransferase domain-containing protein n=1 Tax=Actinoplanes sp. CA-142083 TaxID=3239903 RepID=UPI003D93BA2C
MSQPDIEAWDAWHPRRMADHLRDLEFPWFVAAGWAVDLFRGEQTRDHGDLEIGVPAGHFAALPPLFPGLEFWVPVGEGVLTPMTAEALAGESHQTWAWDPAAARWRFDVFREPHDGEVWVCRRDERIRRPYREIIRRTDEGVPYLAIEATLLFKAKHKRDKDELDFTGALPLMSQAERGWLDATLGLVHPDHPWRARLRRGI